MAYAERKSLNGDALVRSSRLVARIDNNAIADGFQLYLHSFVVTKTGEWTVVQQGMNNANGLARRYHWHSAAVQDFVREPHTGIVGAHQGVIMNLVDAHSSPAQKTLLQISRERPDATLNHVRQLQLPRHHDVRAADVDLKRLGAVLAVAYERDLQDFASLLLLEKLGPRTLQTLALVAEVIHGTPTRFSDPARFSFALGGKDGHPFPVPLKTYDETLSFLRRSLDGAKLQNSEKENGLKRLDQFVRQVEKQHSPQASFDAVVDREKAISPFLEGRSVFHRRSMTAKKLPDQLPLF
jgi:hypothetical protein